MLDALQSTLHIPVAVITPLPCRHVELLFNWDNSESLGCRLQAYLTDGFLRVRPSTRVAVTVVNRLDPERSRVKRKLAHARHGPLVCTQIMQWP